MAKNEIERELVLQREMPYARELVWTAMTVPEHKTGGGGRTDS